MKSSFIRWLSPVASLLLVAMCVGYCPTINAKDIYARIAGEIRTGFESSLHTLDPDIQRHYAVRIYRTTGDTSLIYPILFDVSLTIDQLERDLDSLGDPDYCEQRTAGLFQPFSRNTRKAQMRGEVLKKWEGELIYLNVLTQTNKLFEYGLDSSRFSGLFERAKQVVAAHNFAPFLLDTAVVRVFAPQAVNYVYYLQALGAADFRDSYRAVVESVFPDSLDRNLDADEFGDKLYALTHIVLAASCYYQEWVDSSAYGGITSYFAARSRRILQEATPDIIAEVGLCFCLTRQEQNPLVDACRKAIVKAYDAKNRMIPSVLGNTDLAQGEHRNVLAVMLLAWPKRLYAGPNLPRYAAYQSLFEGHKDRITE